MSKKQITPSPNLDYIAATDGINELRDLDRWYEIIPTLTRDELTHRLDDLETLFTEERITVLELVTHQPRVLSMATGIPRTSLSRYQRSADAQHLHLTRNLLVAIAALGAATITVDSPATRPDVVYSHAVRLARRTTAVRRPMYDDEILLLRVASHLWLRRDPRDQAPTVYTMLDAGLVPGETSRAAPNDFSDYELPDTLHAAGNGQLHDRIVSLDRWASHCLGRHLEAALQAGHPMSKPLTYTRRPDTSADSQAHITTPHRQIDRILKTLGLPVGDITASSIPQWRVATTLTRHGYEKAFEVSGRHKIEHMYRALGDFKPQDDFGTDDDATFADAV